MTGKPIFNKPVMIRVKPETYEKLIDIAKRRHENISLVIRDAIKAEIEFDEDINAEVKSQVIDK